MRHIYTLRWLARDHAGGMTAPGRPVFCVEQFANRRKLIYAVRYGYARRPGHTPSVGVFDEDGCLYDTLCIVS